VQSRIKITDSLTNVKKNKETDIFSLLRVSLLYIVLQILCKAILSKE
jgi:hypothetical protein